MASKDKVENLKTVSYISLVLSIVAVVLSFAAFTNINNLREDIIPDTRQVTQNADSALARAEAWARLATVRADLAIDQNYQEAANEVAAIRENMSEELVDASGEVREEWNELDAEFEQVENDLRNQTANALQSLENLIQIIQQDIRTDED